MSDTPPSKYDVFASYAWSTAVGDPRVRKMVDSLCDVHGLKIFIDKTELGEGNNVWTRLTNGEKST